MLIILIFLLLIAFAFAIYPVKRIGVPVNTLFMSDSKRTSDISAIILFVSNLRKNSDVKSLLAYKVINNIIAGKKLKKYVWLLHGPIDERVEDGSSSYSNAIQLKKLFKSDKLEVKTFDLEDIYDANESYLLVNRIYQSELSGVSPKKVVCDCTAGPKPVTLGIALACIAERNLIYFKDDEAEEFLEIDRALFLKTMRNLSI